MANADKQIVVYHYSFSPYAKRIIWYLTLRGIPYAEVKVPPYMPRPDLSAIGVKYRRIPVVAIGKDVYCDTRLILDKLETLFPDGALGSSDSNKRALEKLLSISTIDAGTFTRGSQLIASDLPIMQDPKFTKDREQFSGRPWNKEIVDANRPEALAHIRLHFKLLETTLLADGRDWILKTEKPSLADIEGVWVVDWLVGMKGALEKDIVSEKTFPKVFAWRKRWGDAIKAAKAKGPKPTTLKGNDAAKSILNAKFAESNTDVDSSDPLKLQSGTQVEVYPIDSGFGYKDTGSLLALNADEVVITLQNSVRIHFPRGGFRIKAVKSNESRL